MLKETFNKLLLNYTGNQRLIDKLWLEIEQNYSHKKRYYHTLAHLQSLLAQLMSVKDKIEDWETVLLTLYYHDIVYNATSADNEEKSADLGEQRMREIPVPFEIKKCKAQILATKKHLKDAEPDTNYFTDADLSVLGQDWETYSAYYKNVRKEYSVYPNLIYNPGRKKVLKHFLEMERIYKTDFFHLKFEDQAKKNVRRELELL